MGSRYKVRAVNDDRDFCECCGRQGLKQVVWVEDIETQAVKHFGTTCATAPAKGFGIEKEIRSAVSTFKAKQQAVAAWAHKLYRKAGGTYTGNGQEGWKANDVSAFQQCLVQARAELK
jgi:hypothetical protein